MGQDSFHSESGDGLKRKKRRRNANHDPNLSIKVDISMRNHEFKASGACEKTETCTAKQGLRRILGCL
jgi:hypothetical protein